MFIDTYYFRQPFMKVLKLTLAFTLSINLLYSQEIDKSWFIYPDVLLTQVNTFDPDESQINILDFGVDQVWDFSFQRRNSLVDTTWFKEAEEMVFSEHFPDANVGRRNVNPFYDWEWYYRIEQDTIFDMGFAYIRHVGNAIDTFIGPLDGNNVYMANGMMLGDTLWSSELKVTNQQFIGTGTVITSSRDTFQNCILLKSEFPQFGNIEYRWYQNDLTKEVAVYVPSESSNPNASLTWIIDYQNNSPTSTHTPIENTEIEIMLNNGQLVLNNKGDQRDLQLTFYDLSGRLLYSENLFVLTGENYINANILKVQTSMVCLLLEKETGKFWSKKIPQF